LIGLEHHQRSRQRYYRCDRGGGNAMSHELRGLRGWCACAFAAAVLGLAFVIPLGQLLIWSAGVVIHDWDLRFVDYVLHTLFMAGAGAALVVLAALALSLSRRRSNTAWTNTLVRLATLGYALPGTVLAVGIVIPVAGVDNLLIEAGWKFLGREMGPLLGGGLCVVLVAYLIRFLAVGFGAADSALQRVTPSMEEAARSLGVCGFELLLRVHFPLLRGGLLTAFLLAFVDIMKEMPITLLTRPFGWDTLAVRIFEMTSEGEWQRAALPSVVLVLAGLLPIILLNRAVEKRHA
ncbi:MAG: ABC transporter permease subunit, partial [Methylococcaceae bacterium]|nr:ABC transporter permease subunit [Methylococcaceae bacterium]